MGERGEGGSVREERFGCSEGEGERKWERREMEGELEVVSSNGREV